MPNPPPLPPRFHDGVTPPPLPPGRRDGMLLFFIGLILGSAVSLAIWPATWRYLNNQYGTWVIFAVPAVKIALGITFACVPTRRMLGAGILASLGVGFLIFFGTCAINIGNSH